MRMKVMSSLDKLRWRPSTIKPVVKNLFNNLKIPFEAKISEFVRKGTAFHFQGDVPADSEKFNFTFKTGKGEDDDIALYMDVYPGMASNLNVYCDGKWDKFRWVIGCPMFKGSAFDIFIVIANENYVLYVNGWRYCLYKHHIPIERLTTLTIDGDVTVNSLGIVNNWNTSAFGDEGSVASHWELSKNLSDGAQPICTRNEPYLRQIPGGLEYGLTFFFQGLVPLYSSGFQINFKTGPNDGDDIAFHFKTDLQNVVCDSYRKGTWESEESKEDEVFAKEEGFDIIIIIDPEEYLVIVNGRNFCAFDHRISAYKVSTLEIRGDVLLNTCAMIYVDKLNMTCDLSAHI